MSHCHLSQPAKYLYMLLHRIPLSISHSIKLVCSFIMFIFPNPCWAVCFHDPQLSCPLPLTFKSPVLHLTMTFISFDLQSLLTHSIIFNFSDLDLQLSWPLTPSTTFKLYDLHWFYFDDLCTQVHVVASLSYGLSEEVLFWSHHSLLVSWHVVCSSSFSPRSSSSAVHREQLASIFDAPFIYLACGLGAQRHPCHCSFITCR